MTVELYPAIDLRGGRVVRLRQGEYADATVYGEDPEAVADDFAEQGATWIHVVDLDAARTGSPQNRAVVAAIAATNWLESARVARAITQKLMTEEYMTAARSLGAGSLHLLRFHLGPALKAVAALETTLLTADAIIMESGLTYLGLGLGPATPSWGGMLKDAQSGLLCGNLHGAVLPGLFLALTVMGINLLATGGSRQQQRARSKEQD